MNKQKTRNSRYAGAAITAIVAIGALIAPGPVPVNASGSSCYTGCASGLPGCHCIEVIGASTRVEKVKAVGWVRGANSNISHPYHFEMWARDWHHNTPDKVWDKSLFGGSVESGWVGVNQTFPAGTGVCTRLWEKLEGRWTQAGKMVCLKITR